MRTTILFPLILLTGCAHRVPAPQCPPMSQAQFDQVMRSERLFIAQQNLISCAEKQHNCTEQAARYQVELAAAEKQ